MDLVRAGKYLTFALSQEEYGLPVLKVREIIKVMDITQVPQVPAHVRGVINLRGKVIPVVDLRLKFGFAPQDYTESLRFGERDLPSSQLGTEQLPDRRFRARGPPAP